MVKSRRTRRGAGFGYEPAPVDYFDKVTSEQNLGQGRQFDEMNVKRHGGAMALLGGPYPGAVDENGLPQDMAASARLVPLNAAFNEIKGMSDMSGGRRNNRKATRKGRKGRKGRKATRKGRKGRKAMRKSRKATRKGRKGRKASRKTMMRRRRGGGPLGYQMVDAPGMLLKDYKETGLNPEWELAKDPNAFAPSMNRS